MYDWLRLFSLPKIWIWTLMRPQKQHQIKSDVIRIVYQNRNDLSCIPIGNKIIIHRLLVYWENGSMPGIHVSLTDSFSRNQWVCDFCQLNHVCFIVTHSQLIWLHYCCYFWCCSVRRVRYVSAWEYRVNKDFSGKTKFRKNQSKKKLMN